MEFRSLAELNADPQLATSGQTPNHVTYSFHTDGRGTPWGGTNYLRGTITKYAPGVDDFFLGLIVNPLQEGQPQVRQRWVEWYYRFNGFEIESQWKYFFNNEDAGEGDVNRWNWYQNPGKLQGYGASDRDGREPGWWFPRGSSAGTPANKAWFDANVFNGRWIRHRVFAKMSTDSGTGDSVSSLWIDDLQLSDEFIGAHDSPAGNWFGRLIFGANGDVTRDSIPCSVDIGYLAVYHQDPGW